MPVESYHILSHAQGSYRNGTSHVCGKKVQPIPEDCINRKHEILGNYRLTPAQKDYDPRPHRYRTPGIARVELLRRDLMVINHDVILLH